MRIPYQTRATGGARGTTLSRYGKALRGRIERAHDPRNSLRRLFYYLSPYRFRLVMVCAVIVIYTILGLAGPYLMGTAIDRFIASKKISGLMGISLLMLLAYILENLFHGLSSWIMADISQRALQKLRGDMFAHLQRLPL
ncbi:MAG: ABC transporter transmembrane domain-containing protein, partial [Syntrophales bacterium]